MGIFDALNTSVGGLQAQSFALQNISGNIANASTTGYKGIGTSFEDLIPDATTPSRQVAGGVTAFAQSTITTQGTVSASTVATNMAINGDGFFSVQKATAITDNVPVFSGSTDYTRRGDFQLNANGNLINGAGYYLMGITVDPKTGNPTGNVPQVLQFQNNFIPAQATSAVQYAANLPTQPNTPASSGAAAGTITAAGGMNPADFASNPLPTAQPFYTDGTAVGAAVNNKLTVPAPITTATLLSGGANSDSLATNFVAGDTIKLTGSAGDVVTFTFVASGATGNQINVTDSVGTLLNKIGAVTGANPTISAGAITLHSGTGEDWSVSSSAAAFTAANIGFTSPVAVNRTVASTGNGAVIGNDLTTFTNESISGGAVTTYDSAGTPINLQLRWAKIDSASLGTGHKDVWNLFYQTQTAPGGTQPAWVNTGTNFQFAANGSLSSPTGSSISIPNVTVNGLSLGNLSFNLGSGALTQFASSSGAATINTITQNGFAAGQLQSVAVNNSGLVVGTFSNGQNIDLAQVTLSHFNGTNYLKALDGGAYETTDLSGPAIIGASGKISGSSLESSNTDIADEFTKLIVTQQAYSANTKVITTANNMVQDLLNVLR
ncbi:flagellar hook-basal body complex protein [Bradyrhizobium sp.]|jgi:flagellar hook protein FlgE|uniref:flagellar hook-basal body complex protein n=1 Tax=Bradyrhizobium sp. TaxID=376 RepID=UPI002BCBFF6B|nr:flagellar hook-basal body complex protein [Bradyrhizobium sp.]HWX60250.1 flagellar hook-basal body complex protein [Bradyrhizobium sp.]